jgi:hypothetical protein
MCYFSFEDVITTPAGLYPRPIRKATGTTDELIAADAREIRVWDGSIGGFQIPSHVLVVDGQDPVLRAKSATAWIAVRAR